MKAVLTVLAASLLSLIIWPLISLMMAWPLSLLWNWLMPVIFGLPTISFWQSTGLMLLVSILFRWRVSINWDRDNRTSIE